jgi:hypothetical protein
MFDATPRPESLALLASVKAAPGEPPRDTGLPADGAVSRCEHIFHGSEPTEGGVRLTILRCRIR